MNKAKRKYAHECKQKVVTFYKKDKELLDFANSINFQAFVKTCLKCELADINARKSGEVVIPLELEDYINE